MPQWARPCDIHGRFFSRHARVLTQPCLCQDTPASRFTPVVELFYPWNATGLFSRDTRPYLGRHARVSRICARVSWRHARVTGGWAIFHCTRPCLTGDTPVCMNKFRIENFYSKFSLNFSTDQDPNSIKTILNTLIWLIKIIEPKFDNRNQFPTDWFFQR